MTRTPRTLLIGTLCLMAVASYVRAAGAGYEARLQELRRKASADRKAQGLSSEQLRARYPTPEVRFGRAATLCPGAKGHVTLPGTFAPGTGFVVRSDNVSVTGEKLTATQWEADVAARADVPPEEVAVEVVAPVSGVSATAPLLVIGCRHAWTLHVSNGETLAVTSEWVTDGAPLTVIGAWSRGARQEGVCQVRAHVTEDGFTFERAPSQEEAMARVSGLQKVMDSPEMKDLEKRQREVSQRAQACAKLPQQQRQGCFTATGDELKALVTRQQALYKKAEAAGAPTFGCDVIRVRVKGSALEGSAEKCAGSEGRLKATGAVRVVQ